MDISKQLQEELWESIKKSYLSEDYTTAILNSIAYLRDTIREKSDLELDGVDLINQAFSDKHPKIVVSKMETKNDKNIQKGLRELLSGIYTHIRNPRSHDKYKDSKEEAIAIILFVNYLLNIIDKSKSSFSSEKFINEVYDTYFVPTKEYAELLVNDIPNKQIEDTFYKLYESINNYINYDEIPDDYGTYQYWDKVKNDKKIESLQIIIPLFIEKLKNLKDNVFQWISQDLISSENNSIQLLVKIIIFMEYWNFLSKKTRLRSLQFLINIDISHDRELEDYQTEALLLGWKHFSDEEKRIIEKNLYHLNFLIQDNNLIEKSTEYFYQSPQISSDIDDDELPF